MVWPCIPCVCWLWCLPYVQQGQGPLSRSAKSCSETRSRFSLSRLCGSTKFPSSSNFRGGCLRDSISSGLLMKWRSKNTPIWRRWYWALAPPPGPPPVLTMAAAFPAHTFGGLDAQSSAFFRAAEYYNNKYITTTQIKQNRKNNNNNNKKVSAILLYIYNQSELYIHKQDMETDKIDLFWVARGISDDDTYVRQSSCTQGRRRGWHRPGGSSGGSPPPRAGTCRRLRGRCSSLGGPTPPRTPSPFRW